MRTFASSARLSVALLLAFVAAGVVRAQISNFPPQVELRVPKAPTVATGQGGSFVAYELHVTNLGSKPVTLRKVEVITVEQSPRVLLTLADSALLKSIDRPGLAA